MKSERIIVMKNCLKNSQILYYFSFMPFAIFDKTYGKKKLKKKLLLWLYYFVVESCPCECLRVLHEWKFQCQQKADLFPPTTHSYTKTAIHLLSNKSDRKKWKFNKNKSITTDWCRLYICCCCCCCW